MTEFERWQREIQSDAQYRHLVRQHAAARTNAQKNRIAAELAECAARIAVRLAGGRSN